ncbi:MAG: hypothetical protein F6J98_02400 [Moorea sp. SIO4G2]|nr:hypothetical protein [Moorena sp. SIO4G2]
MDLRVDIDLSQWYKLEASLGDTDLSDPISEAVDYIESRTLTNLMNEVDPDGKKWEPLAPSTVAQKKSGVIGRETGLMANSFGKEIYPNEGILSNSTEYSMYFHFGVPSNNQPARPLMGFSGEDKDYIEGLIVDYLTT